MMKRYAFLCFAVVLMVASALKAQTFAPSDAVETTANGTINWTSGEVYATGIGAPPAHSANPAQSRAMAQRAAFVVAIRNLLEAVKGVQVDSETVVENFMVKSDVIKTKVDGIVRGAQILKTQYMSDGSVEVLVGMSMKGALLNAVVPDTFGKISVTPAPHVYETPAAVVPQKPSDVKPAPQPSKPAASSGPEKKNEPATPAVKTSPALPGQEEKKEPPKPQPGPPSQKGSDSTLSFQGGVATGLVIDGRGLGLRPALLPRILDEQGREVYVGQVVTRTNAVEQGVAGYAKDVNAAANNFRVTDNPAVIKGLGVTGATKTDIVIEHNDAETLRQLSSKGDFLRNCRVIIVY